MSVDWLLSTVLSGFPLNLQPHSVIGASGQPLLSSTKIAGVLIANSDSLQITSRKFDTGTSNSLNTLRVEEGATD